MDPRPAGGRRLREDVERLEGHGPVGLGVVVDVDPPDVGLALIPVEAVHVELGRLVQVDRVLVDEGLRCEQVNLRTRHPLRMIPRVRHPILREP